MAYALVGGIGFVVDASLLTILVNGFSADMFAGRLVSFSAATFVTWLLNRRAVFARSLFSRQSSAAEYGRYLLVQIAGALTNLAVFFLLISMFPILRWLLPVPLAMGAAVALAVTFSGAKRFVFI